MFLVLSVSVLRCYPSEVGKSQIKMPKFSELSAGEGASTCVQFAANNNIKDLLLISSHVEDTFVFLPKDFIFDTNNRGTSIFQK